MPATDRAAGARSTPAPDRAGGVQQLVAPAIAEAGFVLEGATVSPAGRRSVVRVVVDLPDDATGSLDLDQVAVVARAVSEVLDAPEGDRVLGSAPYVLEVSSPGVDRPLTQRRHWSRARGRLVEVRGAAGPVTGRVERVDDAGVLLTGVGLLTWADLDGAAGRVQVEFQHADGADEAADDGDQTGIDTDDTDTDEED